MFFSSYLDSFWSCQPLASMSFRDYHLPNRFPMIVRNLHFNKLLKYILISNFWNQIYEKKAINYKMTLPYVLLDGINILKWPLMVHRFPSLPFEAIFAFPLGQRFPVYSDWFRSWRKKVWKCIILVSNI